MRTTIDIDAPILHDLKRLQQREGKSLGRVVSDLLAQSLATRRAGPVGAARLRWTSKTMGARIDLRDNDALWGALDEPAR